MFFSRRDVDLLQSVAPTATSVARVKQSTDAGKENGVDQIAFYGEGDEGIGRWEDGLLSTYNLKPANVRIEHACSHIGLCIIHMLHQRSADIIIENIK